MRAVLALSVCALAAAASAQTHHDIVIVAGQSNARLKYAEGIFDTLAASGALDSPILFHRHHSGNWMRRWIEGGPGGYVLAENFLADFWNPAGDSGLQQLTGDINAAGDTWDIAAFFWFQGEGDTGSAAQRDLYLGRFFYVLSRIEAEYGLDHDIPFIVTAIDYNGDDQALAAIGRTPGDIEHMRAVHFQIGDAVPYGGTLDSRGWPRLDLWHVGDHDDPRGLYWPVYDLGGEEAALFLTLSLPATRADLNGDGILDLIDIALFIDWFPARDPRADLAPPADVFDLLDIAAFAGAFLGD